MKRLCNVCNVEKPFDEMVKNKRDYGESGCAPRCKDCHHRLRAHGQKIEPSKELIDVTRIHLKVTRLLKQNKL